MPDSQLPRLRSDNERKPSVAQMLKLVTLFGAAGIWPDNVRRFSDLSDGGSEMVCEPPIPAGRLDPTSVFRSESDLGSHCSEG